MNTFEESQAAAAKVPLSLRNNLDRINLPVMGLQEEAGRIGAVLTQAAVSGRLDLTPEQRSQLQDRLSDVLWYVALICGETGIAMKDVASRCIDQLEERAKQLDPDRR
jgi:NTP pyrophosphatase (non-canonical NTP hydrolase)